MTKNNVLSTVYFSLVLVYVCVCCSSQRTKMTMMVTRLVLHVVRLTLLVLAPMTSAKDLDHGKSQVYNMWHQLVAACIFSSVML